MVISTSIGRISTLQFVQTNKDLVTRSSLALQNAGREVSTGRRADIFYDLGSSAAATITLRSGLENAEAYYINNELLQGRLQVQLDSVEVIRDQVQDVLQSVLANSSSPSTGAQTLQVQARTALEVVISQLNVGFNGEALFAGLRSDRPPMTLYTTQNPSTGLSPENVISGIIGAPPTTLVQIQNISDQLDDVFESSAADPDQNFESTFYSGTPESDLSGVPSKRVTAFIDRGLELEYGLQANDKPFRDVIKGLAMLAATDASEIQGQDVYVAWMQKISEVLVNASSEVLTVSVDIGFRQQAVETAQQRLDATKMTYQKQIADLENVDPFEAATKLKFLETQMRASYEVTAQLTSLSILNYL